MRFIDPNGTEASANNIAEYLSAVKSGQLSSDSLVYEEETKKWVRADTTSEYRSLQTGRAVDGMKEERQKARRLSWLGWALFASTFVIGFAFSNAPGDSARRLGQSLVFLALAGAVVGVLVRSSGRLAKAWAFTGVMAGFLSYNVWGVYEGWSNAQDIAKAKVVAADAVAKIDQMNAAAKDGRVRTAAQQNETENKRGLAEVMALLPKYHQLQLKLRADFNANVETLKLEDVLSARRLVSSKGIKDSLSTLDSYDVLVAKFQTASEALVEALRAEVSSVLPASYSDRFWEGFDESAQAKARLSNRWLQLQKDFTREARTVLRIAQRNLGKTKVVEGEFILSNDAEHEAFNLAVTKVLKLAAEEEGLIKQSDQMEAKALDNMRRFSSGTP